MVVWAVVSGLVGGLVSGQLHVWLICRSGGCLNLRFGLLFGYLFGGSAGRKFGFVVVVCLLVCFLVGCLCDLFQCLAKRCLGV